LPRKLPHETRLEFFELVCGGCALQRAAELVGVSRFTAWVWWQSSGLVTPAIQFGAIGGLPGTAPPIVPGAGGPEDAVRRRRPLTAWDRSTIAACVYLAEAMGWALNYAFVGQLIGRDRSVVWREVGRNRGPDGSYLGPVAHRAAHERRRRPKAFKLVENPGLCARIEEWMDQGWSPTLIAQMLANQYPAGSMERVSAETIYQALYVQTRGKLRADLSKQLSLKRSTRRARGGRGDGRTNIYREAFTISQRPAEVADRAVPGHWEGDLIIGTASGSAIGTLVERATRFVILLHLPGRHDAHSVAEAMIREMSKLPEHLRRSLTWDRGTEMGQYRRIQLELDMPVYFCDPHAPWQRGSNENTNRLLRFWFEKGTDLSVHSAEDLARIAATLNARPRPTLNLKTPAQALAELLADPAAA
jgi:transposase, IS30 family